MILGVRTHTLLAVVGTGGQLRTQHTFLKGTITRPSAFPRLSGWKAENERCMTPGGDGIRWAISLDAREDRRSYSQT
jgi:hypothetical protein